MKDILRKLGLDDVNAGTWSGSQALESKKAPLIESFNPANGELIAKVRSTTKAEYETVIKNAQEAFLEWRKIPAPVRGDAVRKIGNA
ncbi:MAG: aldehyde dehydrogenase family protein, partial [Woeseia sp.]